MPYHGGGRQFVTDLYRLSGAELAVAKVRLLMDTSSTSDQPLDRYIDRFLYAEGWRVTNVESTAGGLKAVTITKTIDPDKGVSITRSATSAGEATFMAASGARKQGSPTLVQAGDATYR